MGESYAMTGDVKKAPQVQENMIQDMQYLQEQLGQKPGSSTEEPGEPAPEVVAAQKQMASCKFAYVADQQRAAISNNYDAFSLFESHLNQFPDARIRFFLNNETSR